MKQIKKTLKRTLSMFILAIFIRVMIKEKFLLEHPKISCLQLLHHQAVVALQQHIIPEQQVLTDLSLHSTLLLVDYLQLCYDKVCDENSFLAV